MIKADASLSWLKRRTLVLVHLHRNGMTVGSVTKMWNPRWQTADKAKKLLKSQEDMILDSTPSTLKILAW